MLLSSVSGTPRPPWMKCFYDLYFGPWSFKSVFPERIYNEHISLCVTFGLVNSRNIVIKVSIEAIKS
jgi:hypothetical protein